MPSTSLISLLTQINSYAGDEGVTRLPFMRLLASSQLPFELPSKIIFHRDESSTREVGIYCLNLSQQIVELFDDHFFVVELSSDPKFWA